MEDESSDAMAALYDGTRMAELDLERPEKRRLRVRHEGRESGPLVVYFHGSPSSRLDLTFGAGRTEQVGAHAAAFDRPGYGGSDYHPFTLSSIADDAVAVAAALGYERFGVLGFSAGSGGAAATAALYPDRVIALGIVGGAAPYPEVPEELSSLSDAERHALGLVGRDDAAAERLLAEADRPFVDVLSGADADVIGLWRSIVAPADAEC